MKYYLKEFKRKENFIIQLEKYSKVNNHKRMKVKLKGMSPVQYRIHALQAAKKLYLTFWGNFILKYQQLCECFIFSLSLYKGCQKLRMIYMLEKIVV
uniref:IS3 family transposase n=1 Tax=Niallia sp. XMNu-256 TaxID=3082444 RepID=UPI00403F95F1